MANEFDSGDGIFTALMGVAVVALAVAVGVLWFNNADMTADHGGGLANPFVVVDADARR